MSSKTVTRADLYETAYKFGLTRTECATLVELVLKEITDCLERGEKVKLQSFGLFVVRKKGRRMGDRQGGADLAPPCRGVQAFRHPQAEDQWARRETLRRESGPIRPHPRWLAVRDAIRIGH